MKLPNTDIDAVTLDNGCSLCKTPADEESLPPFMIVSADGEKEWPWRQSDARVVFNTLRTHERTIELLIANGDVPAEQVERARKMARELK
jgi:hypothetical protein